MVILCAVPLSVKAVGIEVKSNIELKNSSSTVNVKARVLGNLSEEEKKDFMLTVKTHAQLKSNQDLENFAKGILIKDEDVEDVEIANDTVEVTYKLPAKFLGVFGSSLKTIAGVQFDSQKKNPKEVTIKFPWYRIFFSLDESVREDVIKAAIEGGFGEDPGINSGTELSKKGRSIQLISSLLKEIRVRVEAK